MKLINQKYKKVIAITLLINFLNSIITPTVMYALTAGPTAPEATSFEPVDTTDMVNLSTGDFTYGIPLLEVPGPAGGYPLALSYHAGIQPGEEASWVGLGWSLNPGAINRNVNGYADDHKSVDNVVRDFWEGGEQHGANIGLTIGIANSPASVTFGLEFSQDTYQGFGIGASVGANLSMFGSMEDRFSKNSPGKLGFKVGISPYGNAYASAGGSVRIAGTSKLGLNLGAGGMISSKGASGGANLSLSDAGGNSMGLSLNSKGVSGSYTVGGGSASVNNSNAGRIQTSSSSFGVDIPIFPKVSLSLGYNYTRYWSDETSSVATNGSLYSIPQGNMDDFDDQAFDSYSLIDPDLDIVKHSQGDKVLGGSFANYDNYSVNAQGVSGAMRPYVYHQNILRQNIKTHDAYSLKQYLTFNNNTSTGHKVGFRFENDFSNKYLYDEGDFDFNGSAYPYGPLAIPYYVAANQTTGSYSNGKLPGSKNIEWYTNAEILASPSTARQEGFIDGNNAGFMRSDEGELADQIGGFMITNESGVTYHFALPAYAYDEVVYTENTEVEQNENGKTFNQLTKPGKYAYTWFLTGVTGPDYVDRNNDGLANEGDWGYWVAFDYGMWADNYQWRNPGEGFHKDLEAKFQSYSRGKKEIYYLDAIRTATHTAIFEKEMRLDGKGLANNKEGNIRPYVESTLNPCGGIPATYYDHKYYPTASLKLDNIYLFNNKDLDKTLDQFRQLSTDYDHDFYLSSKSNHCEEDIRAKVHMGSNVIDKRDLDGIREELEAKSLRMISYNYDYSLAPKTANSFGDNELIYRDDISTTVNSSGKLTLKSLSVLGKGGVSVTPPTRFDYELTQPERSTVDIQKDGNDYSIIYSNVDANTPKPLKVGDILKYQNEDKYFVLTHQTTQISFEIKFITNPPTTNENDVNVIQTKNPPYSKDKKDMWGLYKSDYEEIENNQNLSKITTDASALGTDVWSLRQITSSLGAKIKIGYEPDTYKKPELYNSFLYQIESVSGKTITLFNRPKLDWVGDKLSVWYLADIEGKDLDGFSVNGIHVWERHEVEITAVNETYKTLTLDIDLSEPIEHYVDYVFKGMCAGVVSIDSEINYPGGGLRVKNVTVENPLTNESSTTKYTYSDINNIANTSGVTSFEPWGMDQVAYVYTPDHLDDDKKDEFQTAVNENFSHLLANAREVPSPSVMYEYVTVGEEYTDKQGIKHTVPNTSTYHYKVFDAGQIGFQNSAVQSHRRAGEDRGVNYADVITRNVRLKNNMARIGTLKSTTLYDGNGKKLNATINHYLHDNINGFEENMTEYEAKLASEQYNNQGVVHEVALDARYVKVDEDFTYGEHDYNEGDWLLMGTVTKRETFPSIQSGVTNINYQTGMRTTTENLKFDFYSGVATKTMTTDTYGNRIVTETVPAYQVEDDNGNKIYAGVGGMGLKGENIANKNMLSQIAETYTYQLDPADNKSYLSASVQTWNDKWAYRENDGSGNFDPVLETDHKIWRKHQNYIWYDQEINPDGTHKNFTDFEWSLFNPNSPDAIENANTGWLKNAELKLYDRYSHALEAEDAAGHYAATKMSSDNTMVYASVANAKYTEFAFSGAEDNDIDSYFGGEIAIGNGIKSQDNVHTGAFSLEIPNGEKGFIYNANVEGTEGDLQEKRTYRASTWTNNLSSGKLYYTIDNVTQEVSGVVTKKVNMAAPEEEANFWYLITANIYIPENTSSVEIGCKATGATTYFDDFRIHPIDGPMSSFVYDSHTGEITYILDNNNLFTKFEYDVAGRLVATYKETFKHGVKKLSEYKYNYALNNQ